MTTSRSKYPPLSEAGRPRVIVTGGREYTDWAEFVRRMDRLVGLLTFPIICAGDNPHGADMMAREWADGRRHTFKRFRADWERHGPGAGPIRNREMAIYAAGRRPAYCLAFWNGKSSGTADTIAQARKRGIRVRIIRVRY